MKVLGKVKIIFIMLNFAKFVTALVNGTLTYKETIEFIAACAAIRPEVSAALGMIPFVGPGLVTAIVAVNLGAADVVQFLGDPEGGLNWMGIQIKGESAKRKTDRIDFSTVDISQLDPAVQNALKESIPLIKSGKKISEILSDPSMLQKHPWLKGNDIRYTQFSGTLGAGGFYKQYKSQPANAPANQNQNVQAPQSSQTPQSQPSQPGQPRQQGQQGQPQQAQPRQQIRNYNDLLYKAYVDVVQTTNVTLENLVNFKDQIIDKINALAPSYPSINSQQSIQMLENRIRKYSNQAKPA
jgi:hypothetical protein